MSTCYENSDRYFTYHDATYCVGTEVIFSDRFAKSFRFYDEPIWKYARFYKRVNKDGRIMCMFTRKTTDFWWLKDHGMTWDDYNKTCGYFSVEESQLNNAIEEITKPIEIEIVPLPKYKDWEVLPVMVGWVIYILVLFFSFIFKEWYLLWAAASFVFFSLRKALLNR